MNIIAKMEFGSTLYGTRTPDSDTDYKVIYIPTAREIVLGNYPRTIQQGRKKADKERNTKDDVDVEIFSLDRFLELLMEGQTVALDFIFGVQTNDILSTQGAYTISSIIENLDRLLTKNVAAFFGYAKQQSARYGVKGTRMDALKKIVQLLNTVKNPYDRLFSIEDKLEELVTSSSELISLEKTPLIEWVMLRGPGKQTSVKHLNVCNRKFPLTAPVKVAREVYTEILNEYGERAHKANLDGNKDFKALSHAVRVNNEALELLQTGQITFPRPEAEHLKAIKTRQVPYDDIATEIEEGLVKLYEASETSRLRETPDKEWVDEFIYKVYSEVVRNA